MALRDGEPLYFYELHEGDEDVYSDILLAHDNEYDEDEFLEMVLEARAVVVESYEEDTLSEAVAHELARQHGFLPIEDSQLRVAVTVSAQEGETQVAAVEEGAGAGRTGGDSEEDYRSLVVDMDKEDLRWGND